MGIYKFKYKFIISNLIFNLSFLRYVKFIVYYPIIVIAISVLFAFVFAFTGAWFSSLSSLKIPPNELTTIGTPISNRRIVKENLDKLLAFKDLYSVDDMMKSFNLINGQDLDEIKVKPAHGESSNKFAIISSSSQNNFLDDSDETEELLKNILDHIGSSVKDVKKINKRDVGDLDLNQSFTDEEEFRSKNLKVDSRILLESSKFSSMSCSPVFSGKFRD